MTLGLCSLSAEHLFHYLEGPYTLYFSQRFMSKSKRRKSEREIPAGGRFQTPKVIQSQGIKYSASLADALLLNFELVVR